MRSAEWCWHVKSQSSLQLDSKSPIGLVRLILINHWTDPINKCKEWVLEQIKWN